jgi:hypothetical protein
MTPRGAGQRRVCLTGHPSLCWSTSDGTASARVLHVSETERQNSVA